MTLGDFDTIHLIGIGGSGMSAIARLLLERGYAVSGSDRQLSPLALSLQDAGAIIHEGHHAENIRGADVVVRSSAVADDNPEVQAALKAGIPVLKRADFLGKITGEKTCIAVAGSHGKTTTTAMIAWMLTALEQDPSYIIGGMAVNLGSNAHAGKGEVFVIEADEYDHMFMGLSPQLAVVTNIEHDHPDCYPTPEDFYQAFLAFTGRIVPGGVLLACGDDAGSARLLAEAKAKGLRALTYGLHSMYYAYSAHDLRPNALGGFDVACALGSTKIDLSLQVAGRHNVYNALAALGVADLIGLPLEKAAQALGEYRGTGRRFELRGEPQGIALIDDYAHHPAHIRATLQAARQRYPSRPIWAVWQPHTYSRTRLLLADYTQSFADADHVIITEVYPAREAAPADGFSAAQVAAQMVGHPDAHFVADLQRVTAILLERLKPGDVLVVLSAGDADQINTHLLAALKGP